MTTEGNHSEWVSQFLLCEDDVKQEASNHHSAEYLDIPEDCVQHENFGRLSGRSVKLLINIAAQYDGSNNGDLSATLSQLKTRGWSSSETLRLALDELLHYGWIKLSRHGGLGMGPNLYAVTWWPIDECAGKIHIPPTTTAPDDWDSKKGEWEKPDNYKEIDRRRREKNSVSNIFEFVSWSTRRDVNNKGRLVLMFRNISTAEVVPWFANIQLTYQRGAQKGEHFEVGNKGRFWPRPASKFASFWLDAVGGTDRLSTIYTKMGKLKKLRFTAEIKQGSKNAELTNLIVIRNDR